MKTPRDQDRDESLRRIVRYLHDCLAAQMERGHAVNVLQKKDVAILGLTAVQQRALGAASRLALGGQEAMTLGNRYRASGADYYLELGALFLVGRRPATSSAPERRFCAPLLEMPLRLEIDLAARQIIVEPEEERFTLNFSLLSEILPTAGDELQDRCADLGELVPDFPIEEHEFRDFYNGFKMIAADLPLADDLPARRGRKSVDDFPTEPATNIDGDSLDIVDFFLPAIPKDGQFRMLPALAIVLARRSGHVFSALRELQHMTELPLAKTAFGHLFALPDGDDEDTDVESFDHSEGGKLFPLPLTAAQEAVVRSARTAPLTVVTGPPGTGKSYTITAIALDAMARGESVLIASQMDKAVEVVAGMIERIAGEYAIARSGGRAAQRELAAKIDRLTGPQAKSANADAAPPKEMSQADLAKRLARYEQLFREAVELERVWSENHDAVERLAPISPLPIAEISKEAWQQTRSAARRARRSQSDLQALQLPLDNVPVERYVRARRLLRRAKQTLAGKPGYLQRWWGGYLKHRAITSFGIKPKRQYDTAEIKQALQYWWRQFNKRHALTALQVPVDWRCTLDELDEAVFVQGCAVNKKEAERALTTFFPADRYWQEIEHLEHKRTEAALRELTQSRARILRGITHDKHKRTQLRLFRSMLRRRDPALKRALRQQMDLSIPLEAFPAWASTLRALGQILPATPGLFDLVIIDEASQCEFATAAVALMRGKRAVVVGDPQQLRHVSFLSNARGQAAFAKHDVPVLSRERLAYRRSLFDLAADAALQQHYFLLDQHFRSHPHIIDFSNRHFYDGRLRIMTNRPSQHEPPAIRIVQVDGKRQEKSSVNPVEVEAVVREIAAIVEQHSGAAKAPTVGVVSPFRDHADALRERILLDLPEAIAKHELVIGTAHSLQGDEKDIVILTTSIDSEFHRASLLFLENANLFNVAVTRARRQLLVVTSVTGDHLPAGLFRNFLRHGNQAADEHENVDEADLHELQKKVVEQLRQRGLDVWPNYSAAGFLVDMVIGKEGKHTALLCDGVISNLQADDPLTVQRILVRAGWTVRRLPRRSWLLDWYDCVEQLMREFDE